MKNVDGSRRDPLWCLRHWYGIWDGHHGRLLPDIDFPTLKDAADELERLSAIEQRAREVATRSDSHSTAAAVARRILGEK